MVTSTSSTHTSVTVRYNGDQILYINLTQEALNPWRNDYAKYALEDDDLETLERDVSEKSGWKLMHGDVFRPSRNLVLFSAVVGTGAQLAMHVLIVILLAIVGMLLNLENQITFTLTKGKLSIFVDCSPPTTPMFEGRGGKELSAELSLALQRCLLGGKSGAVAGINLSSLIVAEGKICSDLYIDGLVVISDGNLLDVLSAAIKVSLFSLTHLKGVLC
ncbi:hypothetical protein GIB67_010360 [Kingdonia uniflora]|uniref:Transmembrane 9 superfamily member n=1 Tax=Kingdonia uniflora TaxID=39325 RepID=A0A7J7MA61_9MAGN|nr:hypothetical protein GIB67_010360 [Kingdonia uniflora]